MDINGRSVFKFPENFVGVVQLKLAKMPADGSNISVKHGEVRKILATGSDKVHSEESNQP